MNNTNLRTWRGTDIEYNGMLDTAKNASDQKPSTIQKDYKKYDQTLKTEINRTSRLAETPISGPSSLRAFKSNPTWRHLHIAQQNVQYPSSTNTLPNSYRDRSQSRKIALTRSQTKSTKITFIGVRNLNLGLAYNLANAGHQVTIAARGLQAKNIEAIEPPHRPLPVLPIAEAIASAEVVFLATPYAENKTALAGHNKVLTNKVLIDCTHPGSSDLLNRFENQTSGSEKVQALIPATRVVKAFTIYGFEDIQDTTFPGYGDLKPAMHIAGDDAKAKEMTAQLSRDLGWAPVDTGPLSNSLHLEHLTLLWIKMGRVKKKGTEFAWAMLER